MRTPEEKKVRFNYFKKTAYDILSNNKKNLGYTFGLNMFSDLTEHEMNQWCRLRADEDQSGNQDQ